MYDAEMPDYTLAKDILNVLLSSTATAEIVEFFRKNPNVVESQETIASRIGRKDELIEKDLEKLIFLGILRIKKIRKQTYFVFDEKKDEEIRGVIKDYIESKF